VQVIPAGCQSASAARFYGEFLAPSVQKQFNTSVQKDMKTDLKNNQKQKRRQGKNWNTEKTQIKRFKNQFVMRNHSDKHS